MARVTQTTATVLYETVLDGRMPVQTNRCADQPALSPPVANDPSTSEYMLRLLCARWNKSFCALPACASETMVKQAVMNPHTRLWAAAVAYALATEASREHYAEYDPERGAVFQHRGRTRDLVVTTADGRGGNPFRARPRDPTVLATVLMHEGRTRRAARQPIADYYDLDNRIKVTVTLQPVAGAR